MKIPLLAFAAASPRSCCGDGLAAIPDSAMGLTVNGMQFTLDLAVL
ncbi:MAG: hypothetical protein ABL928_09845 [Sphingorhabdus sp.]